MAVRSIISCVSKRELAVWGILGLCFVALSVFRINAWVFVVVSVLFLGYFSWAGTEFLIRTHRFSRGNFAEWALPVCMATVKILICLGLVWLGLWFTHHLIKF